MSEQKEKFADELLDQALANYSQAEPRLGLEGRVLARLDEERRSPARVWWKWAWVPAAAALLIVGGLYLSRPRTQAPVKVAATPKPPVPTKSTEPQVALAATPVRVKTGRRMLTGAQPASAAAKLPQFPAPQPLSQQDRLLLAYVRQQPQAAAQQAQSAAQPLAEMKIPPLEIPPLGPGGDQPAPER